MAVTLMTVGEHLSLELDTGDIDAVRTCIQRLYGDLKMSPAGIATLVSFGGEEFTYQNEWDDPCLISTSLEGDNFLRAIHAALCDE